MAGEEVSGPAGPKVLRFLYFAGAGFVFAIAVNKWREMERRSLLQQHQKQMLNHQFSETPNDAVQKVVE
ncbi:uncharacterized protein LOC111006563 [Momordica charantia]|uniref:Uncharacterized protein LOC111006563 n=1 Tax=Momordica charantia TaxID=3673 RepID=A0A6J1C1U1_MOMCH|nr:uncharacterized protein LOC111006563 [Momordica charantia]XP_022134378.1 uncharacterized protein LOC111006563 [Momordica charantia]